MLQRFFLHYLKEYRPFKTYWNYEDGCVLTACRRLYETTGDTQYADFIMAYLSRRVEDDGSIPTYPVMNHSLDSFNCSKALFFADAAEPRSKYHRALEWQLAQLSEHPRTKSGLFWHKQMYPQQVWLDGLYMLMPFLAEYALWSPEDAPALYDEIRRGFRFVYERLHIPENGLYRHGLDEARKQIWADAETGLSASHWLRGEGWLLMALADVIGLLPERQNNLAVMLTAMLREAAAALVPHLGDDGLLYHIIDRPDAAENYTETSGNAMIAYAFLRGASMGILPQAFAETGNGMLSALERQKLVQKNGDLLLTDICACAGLGGATCRDGSCAYYCAEPRVSNDPKGVGALLMAHAAALQWQNQSNAASTRNAV